MKTQEWNDGVREMEVMGNGMDMYAERGVYAGNGMDMYVSGRKGGEYPPPRGNNGLRRE